MDDNRYDDLDYRLKRQEKQNHLIWLQIKELQREIAQFREIVENLKSTQE
jgi:hypothetical protein